MKQGIYEDHDEAEYHADPALSYSSLKVLLDCPARFVWERENPPAPKDAWDLGSVVHTLVLGEGFDVAVIDAPDWRTKDARAARDAARAAGLTPILASAYEGAVAAADAVLANPQARALMETEGGVEVSMWWNEVGLPMRGRVDKVAVTDEGTTLVDLKSAVSVAPRQFTQAVVNYSYSMQQAVYRAGWTEITGEAPGFAFVAVETKAPYLSAVYVLDDVLSAHGMAEFGRAVDLYRACSESGEWPGYPGGVLAAPGWLRSQMRSEAIDGDPWGDL